MLDRALITHASPTLARLKPGSLFTVPIEADTARELRRLNGELACKGLRLIVLRVRAGRALMYLYRERDLARTFEDAETWAFLSGCGYKSREMSDVLAHLRRRLRDAEGFPHEIGVFLGYPLADVIGFIENGGQNCLCCGCWKVYSDACGAMRAFARFRKCRAVYERLFDAGCPLAQLAVATRAA